MTWTVWAAIVIVILTVAALIKRYETRLVLLASGFLMTCLSLDPMQGLNAFKIYDKQRVDHGNLLCDGLCFCRSNDQMRCSFSEASVGSVK